MGERLVDPVNSRNGIAYLDTDIVVWLAQGSLTRFTPRAVALLEETILIISPMVLLELELRHEKDRIKLPTREIERRIMHTNGVRLCDLPFATIAAAALDEKWTRNPFDRLVVANAKANGFAWLISADETVRKHYPRAVW